MWTEFRRMAKNLCYRGSWNLFSCTTINYCIPIKMLTIFSVPLGKCSRADLKCLKPLHQLSQSPPLRFLWGEKHKLIFPHTPGTLLYRWPRSDPESLMHISIFFTRVGWCSHAWSWKDVQCLVRVQSHGCRYVFVKDLYYNYCKAQSVSHAEMNLIIF